MAVLRRLNQFFLIFVFICSSISAQAEGEIKASEKKEESPAPAPAPEPEKLVPGKIDFLVPGVIDQITKQFGVEAPPHFRKKKCIPAFKGDLCLPSTYLDAINKGGVEKELWKAEMMIWREEYKKAKPFLAKLREKYPKNAKAMWLEVKRLFFIGENLPKDSIDVRLKIYNAGKVLSKSCLKIYPQNVNCNLWYGSMVGRVGTTKGIFSQLFVGNTIEEAWKKIISVGTHYRLPSQNTTVGVGHYVLGVFYRMAPESYLLKIFFGFSGDLERSILHHVKGLKTNPEEIEFHTELGASHLCRYEREEEKKDLKNGVKVLKKCRTFKPKHSISTISYNDCKRLLDDNKLACGYSRDRQQEVGEDALKKSISEQK